jgi:MFS family permease
LETVPAECLDRKIFATLFFAIFATMTGVGIVVPLLPVYAHASGASGFMIGLIFGSFSVSRTVFLPYFGRLSDRVGRKPLIVPGLLAYALVALLFMTCSGVHGLVAVRFLQGIASAALMPVIQAYVGDITPPGLEGSVMGRFNLAMFCGLSAGPLIGGAMRDSWGLQAAFAGMGGLSLIGCLLALMLLPPRAAEPALGAARPPAAWGTLAGDRGIRGLVVFRFGYTFGIGALWSFLPIVAEAERLSATATGCLIMTGVLLSGLIQAPCGALADRLNPRAMIGAGGTVVALALLSLGWATGGTGLFLGSAGFGVGGGIAMAAHMALGVRQGARRESMGAVMAVLTAAHSVGMMAGALAAGAIADAVGLRAVFPISAALMLGCTLAFVLGTDSR